MPDGDALKLVIDPRLNLYSFQTALNDEAMEAASSIPPDSSVPNVDRFGFTAEEMHIVVPEAVSYSTNDGSPDAIHYGELTSLVWAAVRELNARLDRAGIAA